MNFYNKLSSIGFLKNSYVFKFLFVAFIGIHIPLIGILFFVLYARMDFSTTSLLVFTLIMTLIATVLTLLILKKLIKPIELASEALNDYKLKRIITSLLLNYSDEAGLLLSNIHNSILESENFITEKQDLIYLLSHDLRTFAGNPQSLAKMILETNPSDEVKELAQLICDSTADQFRYIENLLRILKEQDEVLKMSSELKNINLVDVVEKATNQVSQNAVAKKIELIKKLEVKTANLIIDQELLTSVVFNLINNAVKFSFSNSKIELKCYTDEDKIYIQVIDQGVGFDNLNREKIFDKFTKMGRLGTQEEISTGLGLYLCRQIIERNMGTLTASSEGENRGATFTIIFLK